MLRSSVFYDARGVTALSPTMRQRAEQLRVRYFYQQAHWLTERFPEC